MAAARWRLGWGVLLCALHVRAACRRGSAVSQELLKEGFHSHRMAWVEKNHNDHLVSTPRCVQGHQPPFQAAQSHIQPGFSIVPPCFALRELLVQAELGGTGQWAEGCVVAARTHLPPGVYVDPYELASLQQHNVTKAVLIPDVVDVEAPEYSATDLTVLLYLQPDPRCWHCFRAALPVHGRYHRPAESSEDVLVALKRAEVLVCCCDERLSPECWQPAEVEAPCSGNKDRLCQWYSATHQPEYEELILRVPVGLTQHTFLVCVVTLLTTVLCSSLILAAVCRYGDFSLVTCLE